MPNRPDFSNYLVHFTTNRVPVSNDNNNPTNKYKEFTAKERLISILNEKVIKASNMPWTGCHAVCLTECPWSSLIDHTNHYSPYGIGFQKSFVFSRNGSPVYYVRADQFKKRKWHEHLKPFVTPFWPKYTPSKKKTEIDFPICDYTHEREWRVPHDLHFDYKDIKFIILKNYTDMAKFPKVFKDSIGRDKFILLDDYNKIEKLWPVHKYD